METLWHFTPGLCGALNRGDTQNTLKKDPNIRANAEEDEESLIPNTGR
jgi:hypothetical protein